MGFLLHLSDLHLSLPAEHEDVGDHKINVIPLRDRVRRTELIRTTLRELGKALDKEGRPLDAVVISGDVTYQGRPEGFALLQNTLEELRSALPPPDRILVVPGNHDVRWYTEPSSLMRYEHFLKLRELGYRTPLLEGIDFDADGDMPRQPATLPTVVARDGSFVLVGLNTANHCGVEMAVPQDVQVAIEALTARAVDDTHIKALLNDWRARGRFDIARLGPHQQRHAADALNAIAPANAVRIAVMHHQLLPISPDEEVKPFDALTNLGEVRDFLAGNDIDLLLHGHKHVDHVYEDRYRPNLRGLSNGIRKLLVCSAGTVGLGQPYGGEVAKLLTVDARHTSARRVTVQSVPATRNGIPLMLEQCHRHSYRISDDDPMETGQVVGRTAQDVHEQLVDLFITGRQPLPAPLICRFTDSGSAAKRPASYPKLVGGGWRTDDEWFEWMVKLWQRETPIRSMTFNHGSRIYKYGGDRDQLEAAAKALRRDPGTGKAVIVLLEPMRDHPDGQGLKYPAFCLVQFVVNKEKLDLVAYFRKQEMRYWWPVNAAELAQLQKRVLEALADLDARYLPGDIATVTAIPIASNKVPGVAVAWIDQVADEHPSREISRLVASVCTPDLKGREKFWTDWVATVKDWRPDSETSTEGAPIATFGMQTLAEAVEEMAIVYQTEARVADLVTYLKQISQINVEFANKHHSSASYHHTYEKWRAKVRGPINDLLRSVEAILLDPGKKS